MQDSPSIADVGPVRRRVAAGLPAASWVYLVVAVAVALLWIFARGAPGLIPAAEFYSPLTIVTAFASVLVGTCFHARHADAWSAHRPIAVAIALSAVAGVLYPAAAILLGYGLPAAALGGRGPGVIQSSLAVQAVASTLLILSTALLWMGFRRARRHPDASGVRAGSIAIWVLAALFLLSSAPALAGNLALTSFDQRAYLVWNFAANAIQGLLAAGVTVALVAGARSGERPGRAWWIAGISRAFALAGAFVSPLLAIVAGPLLPGSNLFVILTATVGLIGALGLLAGFALGLPTDDNEKRQAGTPS
jgi:hypothetical protein